MPKNHNLKYYCLLGLFLLNSVLYGQYPTVRERIINLPNFDERTVHYGYFIGLNQYDFRIDYVADYYRIYGYEDIEVLPKKGFNIGMIGDLRINQFVSLRLEPGLYYSQRELFYPELPEFDTEQDRLRELKSTYIHLPFYVKFNAKRINNFRPFLLFGISTDFNLSSNFKNIDDNTTGVFRTITQSLNYEIGLGFEFYLFYFKFSPSIRGIFSFENELVPDNDPNSPWTRHISNMFSRGVAINITFE